MIRLAADALRRLWRGEEGQSLVELALMLIFVAVVAIAVLETMGADVSRLFGNAAEAVDGALSG